MTVAQALPVSAPAAFADVAPLRTHFYTVALRAPAGDALPANVDMRLLTDGMMQRIRAHAQEKLVDGIVRLTADGQSLAQRGIFFMQAPARFAEEIRNLDGIKSVDMPLKPQRHPRRSR